MKFSEKLPSLKSRINNTLLPLINGDYCLTDLPYHSNIGDILIWQGELEFLSNIKYKCLNYSSASTYSDKAYNSAKCILFHGGGNIGDLYKEHINFLFELIDRYPDKRIIVFPQTIHYTERTHLMQDFKIIGQHPDIHFCVRDKYGYEQLKGLVSHLYLLPDMAFCIPVELFSRFNVNKVLGSLYLKRLDCELSTQNISIRTDYIRDWPTFYHKLNDGTFVAKLIDNLCKNKFCKKFNVLKRIWDWYALNIYRNDLLRIGIKFIKTYNPIYTTRLHGLILSLLCGKTVTVIDNSYGKNLNFVNTWLFDVDEVKIYE